MGKVIQFPFGGRVEETRPAQVIETPEEPASDQIGAIQEQAQNAADSCDDQRKLDLSDQVHTDLKEFLVKFTHVVEPIVQEHIPQFIEIYDAYEELRLMTLQGLVDMIVKGTEEDVIAHPVKFSIASDIIKGQFEVAIKDYNHAIKMEPKKAVLYNCLGYAYYLKGDFESALTSFDKAIELEKSIIYIYFNRGIVKKKLGDLNGASKDFQYAEILRMQKNE